MRRASHFCLLALLAAGCGTGETVRTAVSDTASGARSINPATVAGVTALELWQLRPGVTLGEWKAAHPDEAVTGTDSSALSRYVGSWCAAAQRRTTVGQRTVSRTAFFYPPEAGNLALPDSQPDLVRDCVLGLVWVTVATPDSATGARLTDSVRAQLAEAFGRLTGGPVSFFGSAFWSNVSRFRRGDITAIAALRNPIPRSDTGSERTVIAFAYQPTAGFGTGDDSPPSAGPFVPADSLPLDSAVAQSGLDLALWAPMAALLRTAETGHHAGLFTPQQADSLARPLRRWLSASEGLPLPRRAAALYAADIVLDRALCTYVRCDAREFATLEPLRALGAQFAWEPLGASWVYQRTWLNQARVLDRDSPLGQRILLAQLNAAFDFTGSCGGGPEGFRKVIESGERYLARVPDAPIAPEVHFLVGEAYRDIVALAHGAGDIYADSSRYGAEAPAAARRALDHYRAALRAGPGSPAARAAWKQAWWLKAGLVPRDVRFYCVYD